MKKIMLILMTFLFCASLSGCTNKSEISDSSAAQTTVTTDAVQIQNSYNLSISDSPGNLELIQSIYPAGDDFFVPGYGETEKTEEVVRLIDIERKTSDEILVCPENVNIMSILLNDDKMYICFSDALGHIRLRVTDTESRKTEKETELKFEEDGIVFIRQIFTGHDGEIYLLTETSAVNDVAENSSIRKSAIYSLDDKLDTVKRTELDIRDNKGETFSAKKIISSEKGFWILAEPSISSDVSVNEETGKMFSFSVDFMDHSELEGNEQTAEDGFLSEVSDFGIADDGDLLFSTYSHDALTEKNIIIKYDAVNRTINGKHSSDDIESVFFSAEKEDEVLYSGSDGIIYRYDFVSDEKTNMSEENDDFVKDISNALGFSRIGNNMLITSLQEENVDSVLMYRITSDGDVSDGVAVSAAFENGYSDRIYISDDGCFRTFEKSFITFGTDQQADEMSSYFINRCSDSGKILESFDVTTFLGENADISSDALFSDDKDNNYLLCSIEGALRKQSKLLATDKFGRKLLDHELREKYDSARFITGKDAETLLALLVKNKIVIYRIDAENGILSESSELELHLDNDSAQSIYQGRDSSDLYLLTENKSIFGVDLTRNSFELLFDSNFLECVPEALEIDRVFPLSDDKLVFTAYDEDTDEKICIVSKNNLMN